MHQDDYDDLHLKHGRRFLIGAGLSIMAIFAVLAVDEYESKARSEKNPSPELKIDAGKKPLPTPFGLGN